MILIDQRDFAKHSISVEHNTGDRQVASLSLICRAQFLNWKNIMAGINNLLVRVSPSVESLCFVLKQETLSAA